MELEFIEKARMIKATMSIVAKCKDKCEEMVD